MAKALEGAPFCQAGAVFRCSASPPTNNPRSHFGYTELPTHSISKSIVHICTMGALQVRRVPHGLPSSQFKPLDRYVARMVPRTSTRTLIYSYS